MSDGLININLNMPRILNKVENDEFGLFLAKEWKGLISPYTPRRNGQLWRNVVYEPFKITYKENYAHYMYYGIVYVDPVYHFSGFTKDGGETWKSRKDVKKIPSGRRFNYRTDSNPYATDHWDAAAEKAGQKEKLIVSANKYLRRI